MSIFAHQYFCSDNKSCKIIKADSYYLAVFSSEKAGTADGTHKPLMSHGIKIFSLPASAFSISTSPWMVLGKNTCLSAVPPWQHSKLYQTKCASFALTQISSRCHNFVSCCISETVKKVKVKYWACQFYQFNFISVQCRMSSLALPIYLAGAWLKHHNV